MSIRPQDVVLYGGGECFQRFGVPFLRMARAQDVAPTISRSGSIGPVIGRDGVVRQASADRLRIDLFDLDGDGVLETPALLAVSGQTNLMDLADLTSWSVSNAPIVTPNVSDPAGGTDAFTVEDASGNIDHIYRFISFAGDGPKGVSIAVRENTMPGSGVQTIVLFDNSVAQARLALEISGYVGGAPSVNATNGTLYERRELDLGYWLLTGRSSSVVAANLNRLEIKPTSLPAATGKIDAFFPSTFEEDVPYPSLLDASAAPSNETIEVPYRGLIRPTTLYVKMVEWGTGLDTSSGGDVLHIGGGIGQDPTLHIDSPSVSSGLYRAIFDDGSDARLATIGSGASQYGQLVELLIQLDYNEDLAGDLLISQSVQGGAAVTAMVTGPSGGISYPYGSFSGGRVVFGPFTEHAYNPLVAVKGVYGIHGWEAMRNLFRFDSARAVA